MTEPSDKSRLTLTGLFAAWAIVFAYAFVAYVTSPFQSEGMTKISVFLGWQGLAGMLAVAILGVSLKWPRGSAVRQLGYVPLGIALAIAIGLAGIGTLFS